MHVPRSQPNRITVNRRCLDEVDGTGLKPSRFFDGRHWEEAQRKRIAEGGHAAVAGLNGAVTLKENSGARSGIDAERHRQHQHKMAGRRATVTAASRRS